MLSRDNKITPYIKKIIEGKPIALATIRENGKPHVIVVTCYKVIGKNRILLCDSYMKTTLENIFKNNNVALVGWNEHYEGYEFWGRCKYFKKGRWLKICQNLKSKKGLPCKGAILIRVNKITRSKK